MPFTGAEFKAQVFYEGAEFSLQNSSAVQLPVTVLTFKESPQAS
jgi:hypothetical protein